MFEIYRKLYQILDPRERRLTFMVFGLMLVVAIVEAIGVASIMPFIAVVANPQVVETNQYLAAVYGWLGFESTNAFMFFLGLVFLVLIVGSIMLRAFGFWVQVRFSQKRNHTWSCRLVDMYLHRPYEWFIGQHSGNLGASVLAEVNRTVNEALFPALQLISQILVAVLLILLLLAVDPLLAVSVALVLGLAYGSIYLLVRNRLVDIGKDLQVANRTRFKLTGEMFGGIKDVQVYGLEDRFVNRFHDPSLRFANRQIAARTISEIPSFAMQALVFGGILAVLLYFLSQRGGIEAALPVISLFALAGYRLMPSLQAIYRHLSELRISRSVLETVHQAFTEAKTSTKNTYGTLKSVKNPTPLGLRKSLTIDEVSYRYPNADRRALDTVTLEIPALKTIGLVGSTGSGKTTLVDLILGLLRPEHGRLYVDGHELTDGEMMRAWQRSIGYVPQQIFLADESVRGNIAFGIPPGEIDQSAVERAARIANLHEFITQQLSDGYNTMVGERGVRLSGGQRQRIGIARALYRDPDVLILDEATSALDNLTEQAVMDAVHQLSKKKTIILIAHRLSTVKPCDQIYYLKSGKVTATGTYSELVESSQEFRRLAEAGN